MADGAVIIKGVSDARRDVVFETFFPGGYACTLLRRSHNVVKPLFADIAQHCAVEFTGPHSALWCDIEPAFAEEADALLAVLRRYPVKIGNDRSAAFFQIP